MTQVDAVDDCAVAVAEADVAELDLALQGDGVDGMERLGDGGLAVEDAKDALRGGGRPLHGRDDAAHRFQPPVKPPGQIDEHPQVADVLREVGEGGAGGESTDLPHGEDPDDQQAEVVEPLDHGGEEGPGAIDAVGGLQDVVVGAVETLDFPLLLGEGLDHADAGDGIGQHAGHLRPGAAAQLKAGPQPPPHPLHQPSDQRQRAERDHGQPPIHGQHHGGGHEDHEHVVGEIEEMDGEEDIDLFRVAADVRDQVAGPLAAEEFQREPLQVRIGGIAQVGGNPLADPGQHVVASPGQEEGQGGRARHRRQEHGHQAQVLPAAGLKRGQDVVDHGLLQVNLDQAGRRGRQAQPEAQQDHPRPGTGEGQQAKQSLCRPGGQGRRTGRAEMAVRGMGKSAGLAKRLGLARLALVIGRLALAARLETLDQPMGGRRPAGREVANAQPAPLVEQFERGGPTLLPGGARPSAVPAANRGTRPPPGHPPRAATPRRRTPVPTAADRSARPGSGRSSNSYPGRARATPPSARRGAIPPPPDGATRRGASARHREDCSTATTRKLPRQQTGGGGPAAPHPSGASHVTKLHSIT